MGVLDEVGAVLDPNQSASEDVEDAIDTGIDYSPIGLGSRLVGATPDTEILFGSEEARGTTGDVVESGASSTVSLAATIVRNQREIVAGVVVLVVVYTVGQLFTINVGDSTE